MVRDINAGTLQYCGWSDTAELEKLWRVKGTGRYYHFYRSRDGLPRRPSVRRILCRSARVSKEVCGMHGTHLNAGSMKRCIPTIKQDPSDLCIGHHI